MNIFLAFRSTIQTQSDDATAPEETSREKKATGRFPIPGKYNCVTNMCKFKKVQFIEQVTPPPYKKLGCAHVNFWTIVQYFSLIVSFMNVLRSVYIEPF